MPTNDPSTTSGVDPQPSTPESRLAELQEAIEQMPAEAAIHALKAVTSCLKVRTPPTPAPTTLEEYQAVASEVDPRLVVRKGAAAADWFLDERAPTIPPFVSVYEKALVVFIDEGKFGSTTAVEWTPGTFHDACVYAASLLPAEATLDSPAEEVSIAAMPHDASTVLVAAVYPYGEPDWKPAAPQLDEAAVEAAGRLWNEPRDLGSYADIGLQFTRKLITAYLSALSHTPAQHPDVATVGRVKAVEREVEQLREQNKAMEMVLRRVDSAQSSFNRAIAMVRDWSELNPAKDGV